MDQGTLVKIGQDLVRALDNSNLAPRLAMWVHSTDTDTWKLWIVPPKNSRKMDKREFYRQISQVISGNKELFSGIDASDTEMMPEDHPAIEGIRQFIRIEGISNAQFTGNIFNGFYLPDGIIIRSDF